MADATGERPRKQNVSRVWVGVVVGLIKVCVVLALLGGGVYTAWWFNATEGRAQRGSGERGEASRLVEVDVVGRGDHAVRLRAMGTVMPANEAAISPRVAGTIVGQSESFVSGGFFDAGAFMVQIDRADYEQALVRRASELAQAEADLKIELGDQAVAEEELELLEVDIPEINRDLILRKPQVNRARAAVRSARASVDSAALDLDRTRIVAPFDGQLVERNANVGSNVSEGEVIGTLVGTEVFWVEVAVPVGSLRWIDVPRTAGDKASAARVSNRRAWGDGVHRVGRVRRLVGRLEEGTRLARLIVEVPDPLGLDGGGGVPELLLDSFVEVVIDGRLLEDSFILDRDLIRDNDTVWVMNAEDRLESRRVKVAFRGRDHAYVTAGLDDGDRVVRTNLQAPVDGMLLRREPSGDSGSGLAAAGGGVSDG